MVFLETNMVLFFGRFHPLLVHLPIGFIILAVIFELIAWRKKVDLHLAAAYALLAGAAFGVMAAALGFMLASEGGYNEWALNTHKWTGISTTLLAGAAYFLKINLSKAVWARKVYPVALALTFILLSLAGHYGGNLTHGSDYLWEHAPNSIRALAGLQPARERITLLDSALVYEDVVHHIFEAKCNVCHNKDKQKGGLLLNTPSSIMKGGENGPVIMPGEASESELFRRVTLDPAHEDFMPTEGRTPLTKEETALLEWWILEGAPFDKKVIDLSRSERVNGYLKAVGIGEEKSFLASLDLAAVKREVLDSLMAAGFRVKTIANHSTWLEVGYAAHHKDAMDEEKLRVLAGASENITWLTLSGTALQDHWLTYVGQFPHLTRLRIDQTPVTDAGIKHLVSLKNLEYLNVYGTQLTDAAVEDLCQLSGLKKLYLWQTGITEAGVARITDALPTVKVVYQHPR
ncbi:MAG: hypothetical protein MI824_08200 [Hyphomicrobiales bacterium]|nr:hypothetical protein [Hyphomicrobiales bacterium]